ncbi:carbamate kinase [Sinanaerobacter sp. ZZT-01]|uniref:carbamate kinase n=1 Tax=Sinanaerobacter sp. ZZT-01 TaxID=3111540 RepID=UPI002D79B9DA|nr:carbamate kinase [Sinanaerobacter sp. ZZT-01]WRR94151.1 carbamate kinase [Sinanaerobacter sp. ZZT-01]
MKEKLVIALGGNALQDSKGPATAEAQLDVVKRTCEYIAEIVKKGHEIAIVHGNGPQVGRILLASETAKDVTPAMPFDVCGAMSQGYIGYHIQQGLKQSLKKIGKDIPVVTLVTQMVVDKEDPGFKNPTKPIGPFYSEAEAKEMEAKGYNMKEDAGRGFRRVVASPIPSKICEIDSVNRLWNSTIVVTCGGGGIPVVETEQGLEGVAAVIDKDFAAELLAEQTGADALMILTEVEQVAINFNKPDQKNLAELTVEEAEKYIEEGHFAPGSMLPKVQAAVKFAKANPGKKAIITSLYKAVDALEGKTGTVITL